MNTFVHTALIVDGDETLRQRLVPALDRALRANNTVLLMVGTHIQQVLYDALGDRARHLRWGNPRAFDQRLGFTFDAFRRYLSAQRAAGRRVHVIVEPDIPPGTHAEPVDRIAAYLAYEAVYNHVFAGYGCPVTCLWDCRRYPTLVIEDARSVHDHELGATGPFPNPDFICPAHYLTGRNHITLEPPPTITDLDITVTDAHHLAGLRRTLREWTHDWVFAPSATTDVVLATSETATNGLLHGTPPVRIRGWQHTDTLITQVDDAGGIPIPPMVGYQPPPSDQQGGRGLWLARQLADTLTTYTTSTSTTVRLHFPHDLTHLPLITEQTQA